MPPGERRADWPEATGTAVAAPDCVCPHVGRGWTVPRLVALIWRLVADLAIARGLDRNQMSQHYVLPDRPFIPVRSEIHNG